MKAGMHDPVPRDRAPLGSRSSGAPRTPALSASNMGGWELTARGRELPSSRFGVSYRIPTYNGYGWDGGPWCRVALGVASLVGFRNRAPHL